MAYFEKFWECPACGRKGISALRMRKCPSCGYSKTPQDKEQRSNIEIIDEKGLALASGGPYWTCSSCGSVNLAEETPCSSCGNPREGSDTTSKVIELGSSPLPSYHPPGEEQWYAEQKTSTRVPHHTPKETPETITRSRLPINENMRTRILEIPWIMIAGIVAALAGITLLLWLVFHTTGTEARVNGFSWFRDVTIEKYQTVHGSGWSEEAGAYNVRTSLRFHHNDPVYENRTKTTHVSKTCYRDRGNGSTESYDCSYDTTETYSVKVRDDPVYATWYEYDVDKWLYERTAHAEGNERDPHWPEYTLNRIDQKVIGAERISGTPEAYTVHFRSTGVKQKDYTYTTSESEWMRYSMEVVYPLKVNTFGVILNNPLKDKEAK